MPAETRQIVEWIGRSAADVHAFASDPVNLPRWAAGLATAVENVDGQWFVHTPEGRLAFEFVERNAGGVLDHVVTLPSGQVVYNEMRVAPHGDGAQVVFSLRRTPDMSDDDFARDAALVQADLARLKQILEAGGQRGSQPDARSISS